LLGGRIIVVVSPRYRSRQESNYDNHSRSIIIIDVNAQLFSLVLRKEHAVREGR